MPKSPKSSGVAGPHLQEGGREKEVGRAEGREEREEGRGSGRPTAGLAERSHLLRVQGLPRLHPPHPAGPLQELRPLLVGLGQVKPGPVASALSSSCHLPHQASVTPHL